MTGARAGQRRSWRFCGFGKPAVRLRVAVLLAVVMTSAHHFAPAYAQQRRPNITVPTVIHIKSAAPTSLPIQVGPTEAVPLGCFVKLRGLPATAALSDGHTIAPGAWAIPVAALPDLKILVPAGTKGQAEVIVSLLSQDGTVLAEARASLVVALASLPAKAGPADQKEAALQTIPTPSPHEASSSEPKLAKPALSPEARERGLRLVKKGDEQLAEGGIAQARLLYERAAEAGLALGAMAMAATYDAVELERLGVRGLKPDHDAARRWYERALRLGAVEAEERLRRLGAAR